MKMLMVRDVKSNTITANDDARAFFAQDGTRVLHLFAKAAQYGASIEITLFEAANAAMPCVAALPVEVLDSAVDDILRTAHPDALAPLVAAGALRKLGLCKAQQCLSALCAAPQSLPVRRKLLWQLCGAVPPAITMAQLRGEGIRGKKAAKIYAQLLCTVQKSPQLNTYSVLLALAKHLSTILA